MMIDYQSKVSKVLHILSYVICVPAIVFIILYWVKNNELFLTLTFACMASFLLCGGLANIIEIKHCLRKEEKGALKILGGLAIAGAIIFLVLILTRV